MNEQKIKGHLRWAMRVVDESNIHECIVGFVKDGDAPSNYTKLQTRYRNWKKYNDLAKDLAPVEAVINCDDSGAPISLKRVRKIKQ